MMNLFKKNIHSLFGLSTTSDNLHLQHYSPLAGGLRLIIAAANDTDGNKLPNVLESARLKPTFIATTKTEIGCEVAVDGFMSYTENLGFQSSHDRLVHHPAPTYEQINHIDINNMDDDGNGNREEVDGVCGRWIDQRKMKSFPPPLSSFNLNGEPIFFLRPVRKDGRLELTEVRIHRPEIIHATRQDGRLTLHLIPDDLGDEEEEEEEGNKVVQEEEEEEKDEKEVKEGKRYERSEEEEEEEWKTRMRGGSGEGMRRCHEVVNHGRHHHHHHHLQMCGVGIV